MRKSSRGNPYHDERGRFCSGPKGNSKYTVSEKTPEEYEQRTKHKLEMAGAEFWEVTQTSNGYDVYDKFTGEVYSFPNMSEAVGFANRYGTKESKVAFHKDQGYTLCPNCENAFLDKNGKCPECGHNGLVLHKEDDFGADYAKAHLTDNTYTFKTLSEEYDPKTETTKLTVAEGSPSGKYGEPFDIFVSGNEADGYDMTYADGSDVMPIWVDGAMMTKQELLENSTYQNWRSKDKYKIEEDKDGYASLSAIK